jgi:hypothetical protein
MLEVTISTLIIEPELEIGTETLPTTPFNCEVIAKFPGGYETW